MNKLCLKFNIELKYANNPTFNDGWLSGFIDSDGSVYYNESSGQVFISITQKKISTYWNSWFIYMEEECIFIVLKKKHLNMLSIERLNYLTW